MHIAQDEKVNSNTVKKWRNRWVAGAARLAKIEEAEGELQTAIEEVLADEARSGTPPKFSAEQICQIVNISCEDPKESGRPVTEWTPKEIADEAVKRGIVSSISPRQVGRFLKRS